MDKIFDKVYVLNLYSDLNRRRHMTEALGVLGYKEGRDFEFWRASTPDVFKSSEDYFGLSANYMACLNSHLSMIRNAYSEGFDRVLILEDDILPHKNFRNEIEKFQKVLEQNNYDDWNMMYLAYIRLNETREQWTYVNIETDEIAKGILRPKEYWSAMAYALDRKGMKYVLDWYATHKPIEIDRFFVDYMQKDFSLKIVAPMFQLFAGADNYSNNTKRDERIFDRSINVNFVKREDYIQTSIYNFNNKIEEGNVRLVYDILNEMYATSEDVAFYCNPQLVTDNQNFKTALLDRIKNVPNDWLLLSISNDQEYWNNTLSKGNGLYVSTDSKNYKAVLINKKSSHINKLYELFNSPMQPEVLFQEALKRFNPVFYHCYPKLV